MRYFCSNHWSSSISRKVDSFTRCAVCDAVLTVQGIEDLLSLVVVVSANNGKRLLITCCYIVALP